MPKARDWWGLALQGMIPVLIFASAYAGLLVKTWPNRSVPRVKTAMVLAGVCVAAMGLTLVLSIATQWPFWGRHLAPAFPFWIAALGLLIQANWPATSKATLMVMCLTGMILLGSSLLLRFAPWHGKDDYRGAAQFARQAASDGGTIWWCASPDGAQYYGLNATIEGQSGQVIRTCGLPLEQMADLPTADYIILSKPDLCDPQGVVRQKIQNDNYQMVHGLNAFTIFQRKDNPSQR
jgi:hypothetical protein